ncbi:MAG: Stk1 family PASTA domain-containing Ser/Thr kinase [Peptococcaceae bacterium]|nr:Stk1 family PASTA domain-containing Ser/Thr kinase [Peptococcaceae bacterium]
MNELLAGRYQIIKKIGSGGMAIVYLAKDLSLDRNVAIKVLRDEYTEDSTFRRHFQKEAVAIAKLSHNNIVGIYDILTDEDTMCLVMEYVEGETLKEKINREGAIPWQRAVKYAIQIANGLSYAHANQIIHKDVKSQNILIDKFDNVKITDFGIAQMMNNTTITHNKGVLGSAHYFSPEQARGEKLSYQTDIYSFGIVLYEMLVGELPFTADNPVSVALKHIQEPPKSVHSIIHDVPESLSFIVTKCLEKNPENRFASMQALSRALSSISIDKQVKEQVSSGKTIKSSAITAAAEKGKLSSQSANLERPVEVISTQQSSKQIKNQKDSKKKDIPLKSSPKNSTIKQKKGKKRMNLLVLAVIVLLVLAATLLLAQKIAPPSELTVPDFRGMTVEAAESEAARYELTLTEIGSEYSDEYEKGKICSQSPAEGSNVSKGDVISVVISKGSQQSTVPDVRGQTLDAATKTLGDADLLVGSVSESYSSSVKAGQVISQGIEPDSKVERNTAVNLEISLGEKPYAVVPDVRGKSLDTASSMLSDAKLNVGNISYQDSDQEEGTVISQGYNPNDHVDEYTAIDLVVSSGKDSQSSETKTAEISVTADRSGVMQILLTDDENDGTVVFMESVETGDQILRRFDYHGSATFTVMIDRNVIKTIKAD